jgi:hypothetical protein
LNLGSVMWVRSYWRVDVAEWHDRRRSVTLTSSNGVAYLAVQPHEWAEHGLRRTSFVRPPTALARAGALVRFAVGNAMRSGGRPSGARCGYWPWRPACSREGSRPARMGDVAPAGRASAPRETMKQASQSGVRDTL